MPKVYLNDAARRGKLVEDFANNFAGCVHKYLRITGITAKDLARKLQVPYSTLSAMLREPTQMRILLMGTIVIALGIPFDELIPDLKKSKGA